MKYTETWRPCQHLKSTDSIKKNDLSSDRETMKTQYRVGDRVNCEATDHTVKSVGFKKRAWWVKLSNRSW